MNFAGSKLNVWLHLYKVGRRVKLINVAKCLRAVTSRGRADREGAGEHREEVGGGVHRAYIGKGHPAAKVYQCALCGTFLGFKK